MRLFRIGAKKRAIAVVAMSGKLEIVLDQPASPGVERHIADFPALALDGEMGRALAVLDVLHAELGELLAPQAVIEQRRQDRPIPETFQGFARPASRAAFWPGHR